MAMAVEEIKGDGPIVMVSPRRCPNCGQEAGENKLDYDCQVCGLRFCNVCKESKQEGRDYFICCPGPKCGARVFKTEVRFFSSLRATE